MDDDDDMLESTTGFRLRPVHPGLTLAAEMKARDLTANALALRFAGACQSSERHRPRQARYLTGNGRYASAAISATVRPCGWRFRPNTTSPSRNATSARPSSRRCRRHDGTTKPCSALIADLARQAGAVILAVRAAGFGDRLRKDDHSPVTEADHRAEALIAAALRKATPDIPVVAEEEAAAGMEHDASHTYWLVDPLDGTREFAAGHDEFTVNIGLVRHGAPALGVVGVPALGEFVRRHRRARRVGSRRRPARRRSPPAPRRRRG